MKFRFWLILDGAPERQASVQEWIAQTMAAGVRPGTMRWWTRNASGRLEYVLPLEAEIRAAFAEIERGETVTREDYSRYADEKE